MMRMGGAQSGEVLGSMVGVVAGGGGRGCCGETREGDTGVEQCGPVDVWSTHLHREKQVILGSLPLPTSSFATPL